MLIYEWRRYSAAMISLAVAGVLILALFGMFIGLGQSYTANTDRAQADLMILPADAPNMPDAGSLSARVRPSLYMNPEVDVVAQIERNGTRFSNLPKAGEPQKSGGVDISAIDLYPGAPTLPYDYTEETRQALLNPYAIAIDETAQKTMGVKLGDPALLMGHRVYVAALLTNYPNMMDPQVVMSRETLRMLGLSNSVTYTGPLLVRLKHPEKAELVRDQLNLVAKGRYRAWTKAELSLANQNFILNQQIVGIMMGFTVVIGTAIGIIITALTLRGAILANIKELASLRALGVSMGSLRLVMLELSFWVGVVGLAVAGALVWGVTILAKQRGLPMTFPPFSVYGTAALLMIIAIVSGVLSLGLLKKSQPADLLR